MTPHDQMEDALEAARHTLSTLHGLLAADGAAPEERWTLDTNEEVQQIDAALAQAEAQPEQALHEIDPNGRPLNAAGWAFVDAIGVPGPILDDLKPALKAAIETYLREISPQPAAPAVPALDPIPLIQALAAIDDALGMEQDGCNSTEATLDAIRELREQAERGESLTKLTEVTLAATCEVLAELVEWANASERRVCEWDVGYEAARKRVKEMLAAAPEVKHD